MDIESLTDFLLNATTLHVSGACFPQRAQPIECYYPVNHSYHQPMITSHHPPLQGAGSYGHMRELPSSKAKDGKAVVFDRDAISTWRLPTVRAAYEVFFWERAFEAAVGRGTVLVGVEGFLEHIQSFGEGEVDHVDNGACSGRLLSDFRRYLERLGTVPVTLTKSSLVADMVSYYCALMVEGNTDPFLWHDDIVERVEAFLTTRDCFFSDFGHAPYVKATFHPRMATQRSLDVEISYTLALPRLHFVNLCNVVSETEKLIIEPDALQVWHGQSNLAVEATYFIGPAEDWLEWNVESKRFEGIVPARLAAHAGSERQDTYTIPLEMTATFVQHLGGNIRFERVIRVALPLTVRRKPDVCQPIEVLSKAVGKKEMLTLVPEDAASSGTKCSDLNDDKDSPSTYGSAMRPSSWQQRRNKDEVKAVFDVDTADHQSTPGRTRGACDTTYRPSTNAEMLSRDTTYHHQSSKIVCEMERARSAAFTRDVQDGNKENQEPMEMDGVWEIDY